MDLEMWARLSSWPSLNLSNWHSEEDYGLGIPISMVIPDFSSQKSEDEAGAASAAEGGGQNLCDHLSMEDAGDEEKLEEEALVVFVPLRLRLA